MMTGKKARLANCVSEVTAWRWRRGGVGRVAHVAWHVQRLAQLILANVNSAHPVASLATSGAKTDGTLLCRRYERAAGGPAGAQPGARGSVAGAAAGAGGLAQSAPTSPEGGPSGGACWGLLVPQGSRTPL
jgi:hypothetical protein